MTAISRDLLCGDTVEVAPLLLGAILESTVGGDRVRGRIIEVEAYREDDPASHSFGGRTVRNSAMFGPPGHAYVYVSYGIHHCVNVVTGPEGEGAAVLLRAVEPLEGLDTVRARRAGRPDRELTNGPGKLAQAFAIDLRHDGLDVCRHVGEIRLLRGEPVASGRVESGPRVGISKGLDLPWRFRIVGRGA